MAKICLVTPHHLCFNPRLVREADSLVAAGHEVGVIACQREDELVLADKQLMSRRHWRAEFVDIRRSSTSRWLIAGATSKIAAKLHAAGFTSPTVGLASYIKGRRRMETMAAAEPADWYIAHTQSALPAAEHAARLHGAKLGFDCEDLLADGSLDPADIVRDIERRYLPLCHYVSVPSRCIADRVVADYGIRPPLVLYNVFPLALRRDAKSPSQRRRNNKVLLHWFGQTIGAGRGLEEAIRGASGLTGKVEFHIRGRFARGYPDALRRVADEAGLAGDLFFHPVLQHDEMIAAIAEYDIGLALEPNTDGNASLTVSNKLFSYMLAGVANIVSDTPGQREIMDHCSESGVVYQSGSAESFRAALDRWLGSRDDLERAKQAAWDAASSQFCWDSLEPQFLAQFKPR
jgi:glycosyltransferase involved in cell wall biosynthesis